MKNADFDYEDNILPITAVAITVTNILTPYIVRICEIKDRGKKLNFINNKLLLAKRKMFNVDKHIEPKIGDAIVAYDNLEKDINLPSWFCRGIISNTIHNLGDKYNIFLPDYGTSVELHREDFVLCSTDLSLEGYLSYTVGLYNVLPTAINNDSIIEEETSVLVLDEWSTKAVQFAKELIAASTTIYFDHVASDQHGKQYGEFYLNIEDTIISLSEALVVNNYAIYLQKELLTFIKNSKNCEESHKQVINGETIFYANVPNNCKSNGESHKQKKRFVNKRLGVKEREMEKVLIYGQVKYECLNVISDLRFPSEIHKAWNSMVQSSGLTRIQSYICPAIKKGLDVIAIGTEKSGKTFGYGFTICGLLAKNSNLSKGVSPSALILCASSAAVLEVYEMCTTFLESYRNIRCVAAINGKSRTTLVVEMYNGCQILISTPRFLSRFMDENKKLLNFENLQYLILDDGDTILDKYFDSIIKLFKKHKVICNRELKSKNILQIIVTAKNWTPRLKQIARILMDNPFICIASFIEAAIYKSILPKMYVMNSKIKNKKILDLLGDKCTKVRTIIVCVNSNEAKELHKFLRQYKDTLLAHEDMNMLHIQGIKQCWDACVTGSYSTLICTDEVLADMNITNVMWLIHYSVFLRFKTQFNFRHSTLYESLKLEKPNCEVTVMADENSDKQFLSIIKLMQRMNVLIPPNMLTNIEHITATLDKRKENYPICTNIKSRGFCHEKHSCGLRHTIILKNDAPIIDIGINDKVKFRVLNIHDVTHFSARIISYIKSDTLEEIEISNVEYMQIAIKIQEIYSHVENRRKCEVIDVGCICGLEEPIDSFKRVQVVNIQRENDTDKPKFVDVRCMDNGVILTRLNAYRLLHLPEEFVKYPTQIMEVFVVGIVPHDDEYNWNRCAFDAVYEWFQNNVDERSYVIGTVNLHLKNTIWVNTLEVGTKLIGYKDIIGSSLKTELLKQDHAIENVKHLSQMYQLCKEAGCKEINGCNLNLLVNKNM
ncbi:putative ATP-dependent RNA helicase TDRD12 [Hylaeus anthracinus]|uniref:putative ATP-dependent RNA helicase TDRD12 n=1 Tax=Hylaeus anthracinus TaxID=313031 RepID=UPI0023B9F1A7|nr:putative ATP-dependent RNA helicase TDRD12 [Hylaeus anthracinus]